MRLSFDKPETHEETGTKIDFDHHQWGVQIEITETTFGLASSTYAQLDHAQVAELHAFLGTYLER